jgi:hypothetical protein
MGVLDTVKEEFPQWAWLFNHPELGPLLKQAVDPNQGFSANTFRAKVMGTKWWKGQSASQRNWQMTIHNDPGTAKAKRSEGTRSIREIAGRLGVGLSLKQMAFISEIMNSKGLSPDDPEITNAILQIYKTSPKQRQAGAIEAGRAQYRNVARNEYFLPYGQRDQHEWGQLLATGRKTEEDLRATLAKKAASRYAHLSKDLSEGKTMRDLFDGHIQTIAEELELDPDRIDLTKGPWLKVIDTYDPDKKQHRSLSLGETMSLARRDERFWKTKNGMAMGASMTNNLLKAFGMR